MLHLMRPLLLSLALLALTGLAVAQDKDKDKPKDKPTEPAKTKNQELLPGTWTTEVPLEDMKKLKVQVKFAADGTVMLTADNKTVKGKYKFSDDDTIEVEYGEGDAVTKESMKVKVTGKKLTLTSSKGKAQEFDRVD